MCCTRSNTPLLIQYYINDKPLTAVDQYTYLGVTLHKTMSWSHHTHRTLNFIQHTLSKYSSDVKTTAYRTLVRLTLEYAAIVWDPHQQYLIDEIERVQ